MKSGLGLHEGAYGAELQWRPAAPTHHLLAPHPAFNVHLCLQSLEEMVNKARLLRCIKCKVVLSRA